MPSSTDDHIRVGRRESESVDHDGPSPQRTQRNNDNSNKEEEEEEEFAQANDEDSEYALAMSYPSETDYYALLSLSRYPPPSDADIRSAYRTLTLSFHPDKQPANLQDAAEEHFRQIQVAYQTLIDPQKRTVYDLLGAEGVRQQWTQNGAMGRRAAGDAEHKQMGVGVRALSPQEFRRWFLRRMKMRERRSLNNLVQSKGSITLGFNASSFLVVDKYDRLFIQNPDIKVSSYAVSHSFKTPLSILRNLWAADTSCDSERIDEEESEPLELTINAGISGSIQHLVQPATVKFREGSQEPQSVSIPLPPILSTSNIRLGTSLSYKLVDFQKSSAGFLNRGPLSALHSGTLTVAALALPSPALQTTYAGLFTPIPGTSPFTVNFTSIFSRSIFKTLPSVNVSVSRAIGVQKVAFLSWSSGALTWPVFLQKILSPSMLLGPDIATALAIQNELSNLSIGILSFASDKGNMASFAEDDESDQDGENEDEGGEEKEKEEEAKSSQMRKKASAGEAWRIQMNASPVDANLSLTYARNLFSGQAADAVDRSEWNLEGHYPSPPASESRSVRLVVEATLGLGLDLGWSVSGLRRVGDFTQVGLGIGVEASKGLVMTFRWSRLGQKIQLPIIIASAESVNADVAALAVVVPWLAYSAVEFGIVRPRERKKRRLAIARKRKELARLVPQKKEESQQAVQLMMDQVRRRQDRERRQAGLVILSAEYGYMPGTASAARNRKGPRDPLVTDVTIPVAALVEHGQLIIPPSLVKFHIRGFYDPAPLLPKILKVWYTYRGEPHYVEATDAEGIKCPARSHLSSAPLRTQSDSARS